MQWGRGWGERFPSQLVTIKGDTEPTRHLDNSVSITGRWDWGRQVWINTSLDFDSEQSWLDYDLPKDQLGELRVDLYPVEIGGQEIFCRGQNLLGKFTGGGGGFFSMAPPYGAGMLNENYSCVWGRTVKLFCMFEGCVNIFTITEHFTPICNCWQLLKDQ